MYAGNVTNVTVNGVEHDVTFLGAGSFARAYRINDTDTVLAFCGQDKAKDIMSDCARMKHLPDIKRVSGPTDTELIYQMPYYTPLTPSHATAWEQQEELYRVADKEYDSLTSTHPDDYRSHCHLMNAAVAEKANVSEELKAALAEIARVAESYGSDFMFEFPSRNLGVDSNGDLVLFDPIYCTNG